MPNNNFNGHSGNSSTTLTCATANLLNLANPGRLFYANQDVYTQDEFERKLDWLGARFKSLNADVLCVQEVWDEAALKGAVNRSGLRYPTIAAPGAENNETRNGAVNTPRVGIVTRLDVEQLQSIHQFPSGMQVQVPELGEHTQFERPPLHAVLRMKHGQRLHVITAHLKSKRPKFLQDAQGNPLEDRDDEKITARATLRSLIMRGAEAAALRCVVVDLLKRTHEPLIVMGDFNDSPHSVTTQMVAATSEVAYDKAARDAALFNAYEVQGEMALKKDVAYSHVHQGYPEVLDQIFVSEEFLPSSKFSIGDVRRVDYFNDHLQEGRSRVRSDHGFVRAVMRIKLASGSV
jgi:endonuclease/exonuclease/phosphatase family metal-dependent hydrolase